MALDLGADYDSVISALESLVTQLESSEPSTHKKDIDAAAVESSELVAEVLSKDERSMWSSDLRAALAADNSVMPRTELAVSQSVVTPSAGSVARTTIPAATVGAADTIMPSSSKGQSGGTEATSQEICSGDANCRSEFSMGKQKACTHGCDVIFCSVKCWREKRRKHEVECIALRRRRILKSIGLGGLAADEELF